MIKVLSAFIAGVTAGLLFAPHSGKKTREQIAGIFYNADKGSFEDRFPYAQEPPQNFYENIELEDKNIVEPSYYAQQ